MCCCCFLCWRVAAAAVGAGDPNVCSARVIIVGVAQKLEDRRVRMADVVVLLLLFVLAIRILHAVLVL